jgi:hypothetical protein
VLRFRVKGNEVTILPPDNRHGCYETIIPVDSIISVEVLIDDSIVRDRRCRRWRARGVEVRATEIVKLIEERIDADLRAAVALPTGCATPWRTC